MNLKDKIHASLQEKTLDKAIFELVGLWEIIILMI